MSEGPRVAGSREEQQRAWRRLRNSLRPRARASQLIVGALCLLLGLSIAAQVRQSDDSLDGLSQGELVRLLDESDRHVEALEAENDELDTTLEALRAGAEDEAAAQEAAEERMSTLEILAGTVPAQGRGAVLTLEDPAGTLRPSTMLGVVQELRNAGAEVIQVDDVRLTAGSWVGTDAEGRLVVDGRRLTAPYEIRAIGDPSVMGPALLIPGGAADSVEGDGAALEIRDAERVEIDAIADPRSPEAARPVK
ncbi:DUF881 domain-containing protein [Brachybacterium hainanense]|uniref:DUF881 domain-containing protein n=1 Tax=Brachybacterium hainanense TaxID=1541174 RepID=A0ABV6RFT5_9MICO